MEKAPIYFKCHICGMRVQEPGYVDSEVCPECGSFYEYDEGYDLRLSYSQRECLIAHRDEWQKRC